MERGGWGQPNFEYNQFHKTLQNLVYKCTGPLFYEMYMYDGNLRY